MNYSNITFDEFQRMLHCSHTNSDDIELWLHETLIEKAKLEQANKEQRDALEQVRDDYGRTGEDAKCMHDIAKEALEDKG